LSYIYASGYQHNVHINCSINVK